MPETPLPRSESADADRHRPLLTGRCLGWLGLAGVLALLFLVTPIGFGVLSSLWLWDSWSYHNVSFADSPSGRYRLEIDKKIQLPANEIIDPAIRARFRVLRTSDGAMLAESCQDLDEDSDLWTHWIVTWDPAEKAATVRGFDDRRPSREIILPLR